MDSVDVSVIVPTYRRPSQLLQTLGRVADCRPRPSEVIVHIDAGDDVTVPALAAAPMPVRILCAKSPMGPGGGRNRLIREASHEFIVSLDDDSYPLDPDFFGRTVDILTANPDLALLAVNCYRRDQEPEPIRDLVTEGCAFEGCGAIFRRSALLAVEGYRALRDAYGMEESDVVLQLLDAGFRIGRAHALRVRHEVDLIQHAKPRLNAAQISNTALLPFLRYPWPYVAGLPVKVLRRVLFCVRAKRFAGVGAGLARIPGAIWRHRHSRRPVSRDTMRRYLALRAQGSE